jgi:hypothetical protein
VHDIVWVCSLGVGERGVWRQLVLYFEFLGVNMPLQTSKNWDFLGIYPAKNYIILPSPGHVKSPQFLEPQFMNGSITSLAKKLGTLNG